MFRKIGQIFSIVFDTRIDFQIAGQHFTHTLNCKQSFFGNSVILPTEKKNHKGSRHQGFVSFSPPQVFWLVLLSDLNFLNDIFDHHEC